MKQIPWKADSHAPFTEPESSLSCSHEPATRPYPEPDQFSPHLPTLFPYEPLTGQLTN